MEIKVSVTLGDEEDIDCLATGSPIPYTPARISGPPEDCYEAEGGYCEDICVKRSDTGEDITEKLSEADLERISDEIMEKANDYAEADEDDAYNRYADD
jgi:hypothetical protein